MNRRMSAALLMASLSLVACASPAPSAAPLLAPSAAASAAPPSAAPSTAATESSAPGDTVAPASVVSSGGPTAAAATTSGGPFGVADLRTLLPDSIGGHALTKAQFSGKDLADSGSVSQQMVDVLASLGRKPQDMALAMADDPTHGTDLNITAFRVNGVAVATFLESYLPMVRSAFPDGSITQGTRAGRSVYTVVGRPSTPSQVLLPTGDVLFVVTSATPELVDEALTRLP